MPHVTSLWLFVATAFVIFHFGGAKETHDVAPRHFATALSPLFDVHVNDADGKDVAFARRPGATFRPKELVAGLLQRHEGKKQGAQVTLGGNRAFDFVPKHKASLRPDQSVSWTDDCFQTNSAVLKTTGSDSVEVHMNVQNATDWLCSDMYLFADVSNFYVEWFYIHGDYRMSFKGLSAQEMGDIKQNGLQIFAITDQIFTTLQDIMDTLLLFMGPWDEEDALQFVKDRMNITYQPRNLGYISLDENDVHDGDYLATQRFDGSEVMIQYGTGAYIGHSTMAIRINGSLHVCESTGRNSPDYWPPPYGVICTPWQKWMSLAQAADYAVTVIPLAPEIRSRFNSEKAVEFIKSMLGYPYGFHNFIYGWIDTLEDNYPPPLSGQFMTVAFSIFDKVDHALAKSVYLDGINMRLGTNCSSMDCVFDLLIARNQNLTQVLTIKEQDDWVYEDGPSMVCDVFVLRVYKAAGVFPNASIQATEFTPKDLYTLQIWDPKGKNSKCPNDGMPVCQIMGKHFMQFPGWNTIKPYDNMAERCPSKWPEYIRPPGC